MGPVWQKWGDWLGTAALLTVLVAMGLSPYMGGGVVLWAIIYGPMLLILCWMLRSFVKFRPGVFMLSLAVLLAVRLTLNGISYEVACDQDQPVLFKPLETPASFRQVNFFDGDREGGRAASLCDADCLTLLTLRDISFMEISPQTTGGPPTKEKQRVRYDWQNPACAAWVKDNPNVDERMARLAAGSSLSGMRFNWTNYSDHELSDIQNMWSEVKDCFIYSNIEKFEAVYSYSYMYKSMLSTTEHDHIRIMTTYEGELSRIFFNEFSRSTWVLFESERGIRDGLVGGVGFSTMYSYRAFAIAAIDPILGLLGGPFIEEPTSRSCQSYGTSKIETAMVNLIMSSIASD